MMQEKLPPFSEAAEQGVLGGILRSSREYDEVSRFLKSEHFYHNKHQVIYEAMGAIAKRRVGIDLVTVFEQLKTAGATADSGGHTYLAELWDSVPTGANVAYYAKIVVDKAVLRKLIQLGGVLIRDAQDEVLPGSDLLADAEVRLSNLRLGLVKGEMPSPLDAVLADVAKRIDDRASKGDAGGVKTGFTILDMIMGGMHGGDLVCIAARPSVGKSALAQAIAMNVGKSGKKALIASLEMMRVELGQRIIVNESGVSNYMVRSAKLGPSEAARLGATIQRLRGVGVRFDDEPGLTVERLASKCRMLSRGEGLDLVVVDYLQLLVPDNRRAMRQEQVASMSRSLKRLAQELEIPIIVLSQLNRDSDQEHRPPRLSDIRESGAVEQDADTVILLHRPNAERDDPEPIDLIVAKQRHGETGTVRLNYHGSTFRFSTYCPGD